MASKTDIANLAIAQHQGDWIDDIDSATGTAPEAIRMLWTTSYELALAAHPWKWARWSWKDQPVLPADQNPDPDLPNAYRLPPDCVRCFELRPQVDFDEWENLITTDVGPAVTLIGTRRNADIGRASAFFVDYFAKLLAFRICTTLNASEAIRKRCQDDVDKAFTAAASDNGRAGKVRFPRRDSFLASRTGGPGAWWR